MAKAAITFAREQVVVTTTSQSHKITNDDSKVDDGVGQIASDTLKQKSIVGFNMSQTIPRGMDEFYAYTNLVFQPICAKDDDSMVINLQHL